jgi:hypothetical protein
VQKANADLKNAFIEIAMRIGLIQPECFEKFVAGVIVAGIKFVDRRLQSWCSSVGAAMV